MVPHLHKQERISWVCREREGARRPQHPISSALCGWCLSSSPAAGNGRVAAWLFPLILALPFLSRESCHGLIFV